MPVDDDGDVVADDVHGAAGGVGAQVAQSSRVSAGGDGEAAVDEHAVERRHPRLTALVDRRERDMLRSLQIGDDLTGAEAPLRLDDRGEVRVRAGERAVDQRLQPHHVVVGLVHTVLLPERRGAHTIRIV